VKVGKTLYAKDRKEWRAWLAKNHRAAPEIWLIYYEKHTGKPRVPYNRAVKEALCYGWIDSTLKPIDADCWARRYSPRKPTSRLGHEPRTRATSDRGEANDQSGPGAHRARVRSEERHEGEGCVESAGRHRREVFEQRLRYFMKMTAQNKRFGMVQ